MPFERTIDNNSKIGNDFKQIVKECFSNIYETLGKNNFKRWVHTRELSKDVENLIFDWMSEEDKENMPNAGGYANVYSSEIRIRRPETARHSSTHELYHLVTRSNLYTNRCFGEYINEGMTEYLTGMTREEGPRAYMDNVKMVEFLHNMLGDSLIKAYLLGKDANFDRKFAEIIMQNEDELPKTQKEIEEFYKALDRRHKILHPITKDEIKSTPEEKDAKKHELDKTTSEIQNMIRKIILCKIHKMSKDLDFYQDGKITNLSIVEQMIDSIPNNFRFSVKESLDLLKESMRNNY